MQSVAVKVRRTLFPRNYSNRLQEKNHYIKFALWACVRVGGNSRIHRCPLFICRSRLRIYSRRGGGEGEREALAQILYPLLIGNNQLRSHSRKNLGYSVHRFRGQRTLPIYGNARAISLQTLTIIHCKSKECGMDDVPMPPQAIKYLYQCHT